MKRLLMLLSMSAMVIVAAPAYADDSAPNNDDDFLKQIKDAGLTYQDGPKTVEVAKNLCTLANGGTMSPNEIQKNLVSLNPSLAGDGAAKFMMIAAAEYCPKQLHG